MTLSKTNWEKLGKRSDEDILKACENDDEAQPLSPELWASLKVVKPKRRKTKEQLTLRLDTEVLTFYRQEGAGYQTLMNEVLKTYMESLQQRKAN